MRRKFIKIVLHISGVLLFIFATAYALLAAYGYQIDLLHQNIIKTSIIDVSNKLNDVEISFNGALVAQKAPFQIKSITPGIHSLEISKDGYTTWSRNVAVIEDLVTIIDDVVLLPLDLAEFMSEVSLDFEYDDVLINKNYFVFVLENEILIYKLLDDQLEQFSTINVTIKDQQIKFIDNHRISIKNESDFSIIDLRDNRTISIKIPNEYSKFTVSYTPELKGYYLNDNNLFEAKIGEDGSFNEIKLIKNDQTCEENLNIISSYDLSFILCDNLLFDEIEDELFLIDDSVKILPNLSHDNSNLVYLNEEGEIVSYNVYLKEKVLLARFIESVDDVLWYEGSKHLVLEKNSNLILCDLDFSNCNVLLEQVQDLFTLESASKFIYAKENTFEVYDFSKIMN